MRAQYADESRLATRRSVWRTDPRDPEGASPQDRVASAVRAAVEAAVPPGAAVGVGAPRILEVGCGTGELAARLAAENPAAEVLATDLSARMVEVTAGRGVAAQVADAAALPFPDGSFAVVVAAWVLYHLADPEVALAEIRRVLRPGGTFVAATNSERHLADLLAQAGAEPLRTSFSSENGAARFAPYFRSVTRYDHTSVASFENWAQASGYLASFSPHLAAGLAWFEGPRDFTGAGSVFVAI